MYIIQIRFSTPPSTQKKGKQKKEGQAANKIQIQQSKGKLLVILACYSRILKRGLGRCLAYLKVTKGRNRTAPPMQQITWMKEQLVSQKQMGFWAEQPAFDYGAASSSHFGHPRVASSPFGSSLGCHWQSI